MNTFDFDICKRSLKLLTLAIYIVILNMKLWFTDKGQKAGEIFANFQKSAKSNLPKMPDMSGVKVKLPSNVNLKSLTDLVQDIIKGLTSPGSSKPKPTGPRIPMKYPYTLSAKIAQFPFAFYYKNNWIFQYFPYGLIACVPLFWYISGMANSKANKAKWKEIRQRDVDHARHKFDDM